MPIFLQPVEVPERCYLGEALLWVAFQRLPTASYTVDGKEIRDTDEIGGYAVEVFDSFTVKELQAAGCESLRAIAAELDARGIPAARGGKWSAVQVSRLLARVNPSTVRRISRPFDGASVAVA
jgi:hypothetical protein